jgi:hypothetical protein
MRCHYIFCFGTGRLIVFFSSSSDSIILFLVLSHYRSRAVLVKQNEKGQGVHIYDIRRLKYVRLMCGIARVMVPYSVYSRELCVFCPFGRVAGLAKLRIQHGSQLRRLGWLVISACFSLYSCQDKNANYSASTYVALLC